MTTLFARRNAVLLFQVIFAVVCNGHPVDQIFTETPSTAFSVSNSPSLSADLDSDNLPWPTIALFGTVAFILLAGFLIWLGGKIYVAIFGMPELNLEAIQGPNRRERPARPRDPNEITFSRIIAELLFGRSLIEESEREIQQALKQRATRREENILRSLGVGIDCPTLNDVNTFKEEMVQLAEDFKPPEEDCLVRESEPGSRSMNSDEVELGDWELLDCISPPRATSLFEDIDDFVISDKLSDEFERPELEGISSEYGEGQVSSPLIKNPGDVNDSQRVHCEELEEGPTLPSVQTILYFAQLPFFYVSNLAYELKSESNAIRKYFMKLLPFYGVADLEEAQMASWETSRWLLSQLPFFNVSNEEIQECACLSIREAGSDVEAGVPNSEELVLSPARMMDLVHYEDEI